MIKLNVSAANIAVEEKETLTEGRVGLLCRFSFTGEWDGLAKTAVFDGADSRDVILTEDTVAVPAECLAAEGYSLSVGVYGKNAAGDIVIPTVYATVGKIQRSAYPSGRETAPPTPDVVAQIQQAAANAEAMARAVREDAELGKFKGEKGDKGDAGEKGQTGPAGTDGGWYTPAITQPYENTMRVSFSPSKEGMPAVDPTDITLPAGSGSGGSGADGGYYTPEVTQTSENTMQVAFSPSKTSMPAVSGTEITLPAGQKGDKGDTGAAGADGKSAYAYAVEGGYTGTEEDFAAKLAQEKFANPNALTFTGAVTGSYDGSAPMEVEIPSGSGGGSSVSANIEKVYSWTADGTVQSNLDSLAIEPNKLYFCELLVPSDGSMSAGSVATPEVYVRIGTSGNTYTGCIVGGIKGQQKYLDLLSKYTFFVDSGNIHIILDRTQHVQNVSAISKYTEDKVYIYSHTSGTAILNGTTVNIYKMG